MTTCTSCNRNWSRFQMFRCTRFVFLTMDMCGSRNMLCRGSCFRLLSPRSWGNLDRRYFRTTTRRRGYRGQSYYWIHWQLCPTAFAPNLEVTWVILASVNPTTGTCFIINGGYIVPSTCLRVSCVAEAMFPYVMIASGASFATGRTSFESGLRWVCNVCWKT